jgi:hypothetical protein
MFTKGTTAALFAIVIASSLIIVSSSFAHSAYAVTKKVKQNHGTNPGVPLSGLPELSYEDKFSAQKAQGKNAGDLGWVFGDISDDAADKTNVWKEICNT